MNNIGEHDNDNGKNTDDDGLDDKIDVGNNDDDDGKDNCDDSCLAPPGLWGSDPISSLPREGPGNLACFIQL